MRPGFFPIILTLGLVTGCADTADQHHVQNDPGGTGETGAVPNGNETHDSGALNGYAAANSDPISGSGDTGPASAVDPESGVNSNLPVAVGRF